MNFGLIPRKDIEIKSRRLISARKVMNLGGDRDMAGNIG